MTVFEGLPEGVDVILVGFAAVVVVGPVQVDAKGTVDVVDTDFDGLVDVVKEDAEEVN